MAARPSVHCLSSSIKTASLATLPLRPSVQFQWPKVSCLLQSPSLSPIKGTRVSRSLPVIDAEEINSKESEKDYLGSEWKKKPRPCELYVCNLPRSCDILELVEMFKPFGTVISVEVCKNPDTGVSRGCGYVTMGSINSARQAISALDGSDVGGREMRVKFSVDMSTGTRNVEALNSAPMKNRVYESPYKLYIGNLVWTIKPEELRNLFSQFGTVVSARVLYDHKAGKHRAYAFLSFSSAAERDAALSLNGTEFCGRILVIKKGVEKED